MRKVIKILITIIVFFTFVNALFFIGLGVINIFKGGAILLNDSREISNSALKVIESLDMFLVALVFIIFTSGIYNIFFPHNESQNDANSFTKKHIFRINSFSQLKILLWQTILTTLVIHFVSSIIQAHGKLDWSFLIMPISILLLTISLGIFQRKPKNNDEH